MFYATPIGLVKKKMLTALTRGRILERLGKDLIIEPFHEECLGEITYDISLGPEFVFVEPHYTPIIDPENLNVRANRIYANQIFLQPHQFVLGRSAEWIELPNDIFVIISGKSSLARIGLEVEAAHVLHPGHKGYVVLEISNRNTVPVKLKEGMLIAQLLFFKTEPVEPYISKGTFGVQNYIELPNKIRFINIKRERTKAISPSQPRRTKSSP